MTTGSLFLLGIKKIAMKKLNRIKNYIKEQIDETGGLIDALLVIGGLFVVVAIILYIPTYLGDVLSRISEINLGESIITIMGMVVFGAFFFGVIALIFWIQYKIGSKLGKWQEKRAKCHICNTELRKLSGAIRSDLYGNDYHYECIDRLAKEIQDFNHYK